MPDKKKRPKKTAAALSPKADDGVTRIAVTPLPVEEMKADAPWVNLTVKPPLGPIVADDPERGIGRRIAYCRGQLDNLNFEALARYLRYFDRKGIAATSLMRYESGEYIPGARELRILCDAFWVPAQWLLFGTVEHAANGIDAQSIALADTLRSFVLRVTESGVPGDDGLRQFQRHKEFEQQEIRADYEKRLVARRQAWLWEAKNKSKG